MRGFPPIQIFILGLLFGLLAVPLTQLTGNARPSPEDETHPGAGEVTEVKGGTDHPEGQHKHLEVPALIRLRYAHKPLTVSLKSEGHELLEKLDLTAPIAEVKAQLEISHDGNELSLEAKWPPGTPDTALTLEIEPDGFDTRSQTRWSSGTELSEILTFDW